MNIINKLLPWIIFSIFIKFINCQQNINFIRDTDNIQIFNWGIPEFAYKDLPNQRLIYKTNKDLTINLAAYENLYNILKVDGKFLEMKNEYLNKNIYVENKVTRDFKIKDFSLSNNVTSPRVETDKVNSHDTSRSCFLGSKHKFVGYTYSTEITIPGSNEKKAYFIAVAVKITNGNSIKSLNDEIEKAVIQKLIEYNDNNLVQFCTSSTNDERTWDARIRVTSWRLAPCISVGMWDVPCETL
ncbi:uncharacterized protein KGF55_003815 [Candida pseudojiufengensis]|uniref:uncharacterized protein n=1 Tax=Candida pseudojiufengensis TaxID=497109 RepID=UPI0022246588|nr:uncharacterized protein KGF55_003815 [Candida pseudojiufengensis]KAI5961844.1 hypothetical protein KGF55_003815 [Candida pseudojiufengensis]